MKKLFFIFIFCLPAFTFAAPRAKKVAAAAPAKPIALSVGSQWVLAKDLTLQKTGLTPEEFVPYTSIWDLKGKSFMRSGSSSTDSCEFRTTISKKIMKMPAVKVRKSSAFQITNIQETTMSVLVDATSKNAKKSGIDQIQITCSAYEQGLDSPAQKEAFKAKISASLAEVFVGPN